MDDVKRFEDGEPIGDGFYRLYLKQDPNPYTDDVPTTVTLRFSDYRKGFSIDDNFFMTNNGQGKVDRWYPLHNILLVELYRNSDAVQEAMHDYWLQKELDEAVGRTDE